MYVSRMMRMSMMVRGCYVDAVFCYLAEGFLRFQLTGIVCVCARHGVSIWIRIVGAVEICHSGKSIR